MIEDIKARLREEIKKERYDDGRIGAAGRGVVRDDHTVLYDEKASASGYVCAVVPSAGCVRGLYFGNR